MTNRLVTIKGTDIENKIYNNSFISMNNKYNGKKMNELRRSLLFKKLVACKNATAWFLSGLLPVGSG